MEASGGYERDWAKALRESGIEVRIVDPKRVRSFAQSAGRLAKNDTIDAEMIAWFAETFAEAPHQVHNAEREKLVQMVNARLGLLDLQTELQNRGEHSMPEVVKRMQARLLKKIAAELATLEVAIRALIKATPRFAELAEIIESVPGLAETTSAGLIAIMPELGQVNDKIAANVTSRAAGVESAISSTWPVSGLRQNTTPSSRPSINACWPKERRRRSPSSPACAS
jgi:transposase